MLFLGLSGSDHDLLESEGLAQVAANLDLASHEGSGGGDFTCKMKNTCYSFAINSRTFSNYSLNKAKFLNMFGLELSDRD